MSVKAMAWVWDQDIPRDEKYLLLAYADHADHDGHNIFPAVATVSKKTGYSERSVQRITRKLVESGWLIESGVSNRQTNKFSIPIYGGDNLTPPTDGGISVEGANLSGGDKIDTKGCQNEHEGVPKSTGGGDIAVSPEPSLTVIKPSRNLRRGGAASSLDVSGANAVRIYSRITGQVYPPSGHIDTITEDLCNILDKYDSEQNAITDGKKHFTKWCSTRGKSGKTYGRTNPGWLQWWLEDLAPAPGEHKTVEVPRPNALCGDAQRLLFMVEKQDRLDILPEYTDHIKGCFICGGATNAEVVKGQLAKLAEGMRVK